MMDKTTPMSAAEEMAAIEKKLGCLSFDEQKALWLPTGSARLNAVLGSEELGMAYGKVIELQGPNSHGKTMLALFITALAQAAGARCGWMDLENSLDKRWCEAQGVNYEDLQIFRRKLLKFKGEEEPRLPTAEELFEMTEAWFVIRNKREPDTPLVLVVDSIAAILTADEDEAGLVGAKLPQQMALPKFLSRLCRRSAGKWAVYNVLVVFINQIRMAPMTFGNPERTTGGEAMKFFASVRVKVRRHKDGRMIQGKKIIGLRGTLKNIKNKAGEGSIEGAECGFEMMFGKKSWKFPPIQEVRKQGEE